MYWKMPLYAAATVCLVAGMSSCESNPATDPYARQEAELQKVVTDYVDKTVIPTYRGLADASMELYNACLAMREAGTANLTTAMVQAADDAWIKARRYWELSEAWLYGAAADYNIDPHIDSWPLDQVAMEAMLADEKQMAQMDEDGVYVSNHLGYGLLGFHAVEYMIFETTADGKQTQPRSVGKYTTQELNYLAAVAGDLRNQCIRLEAAWAGSVSDAKQQILVDTELEPTMNYGESMKTAGQGGSESGNIIPLVAPAERGLVAVATRAGGFSRLDPSAGTFASAGPAGTLVYAFLADRDGHTWVGTRGDGLYVDGVRYSAGGGAGSLSSDDIFDIAQDSAGRVWIATWGGGLLMARRSASGSLSFVRMLDRSADERRVRSVCFDSGGMMWVATCAGLYAADTRRGVSGTASFTRYSASDGNFPITNIICGRKRCAVLYRRYGVL